MSPSNFSYSFKSLITHCQKVFFLNSLKTVKIIQIFKSGNSKSTVNYRPISMLPFLSKIFQKLMCAGLYSCLKSNGILCINQFDFRKNSHTSDAIIEYLDFVYSSLDSKQSTSAVYLDFSEAFYTVNHHILMSKLLHNGIRCVMQSLFESYLSNREQYVSSKTEVPLCRILH